MNIAGLARADGALPLPHSVSGVPITDLNGADYPPYNIEQFDESLWRIVMAVPGFAANEIEVSEDQGVLVVRGETGALRTNARVVKAGLEPAFVHEFWLADGFHLDEWTLTNGLLRIDVARDPALGVAATPPPKRALADAIAA